MASWGYPLVSHKGRIYVLYSQHIGRVDNFPHHTGWLHGIYSDDNGATWSKAQNVPVARSINDNPDPTMPPNMLCWQKPLRLGKTAISPASRAGRASQCARTRPSRGSRPTCASNSCASRTSTISPNRRLEDQLVHVERQGAGSAVPRPSRSERLPGTDAGEVTHGPLFCIIRTASGSPFWSVSSDTGKPGPRRGDYFARMAARHCSIRFRPARSTISRQHRRSGHYALFIHNHDGHYQAMARLTPATTAARFALCIEPSKPGPISRCGSTSRSSSSITMASASAARTRAASTWRLRVLP